MAARKKGIKRKPYKKLVLLGLFEAKYDPASPQERIDISFDEITAFLDTDQIPRPGSIYSFFNDLVRAGTMSKSLSAIVDKGYLIIQTDGGGAFVKSTGKDSESIVILAEEQDVVDVDASGIPKLGYDLIRTDEGGAISVMEYCGILRGIFDADVFRVQAPVKVQPNEVDGCYIFEKDGKKVLLSVEAKSKGRDVLLKHQIYGAASLATIHFGTYIDEVVPVGIKIANDHTIYVVVFQPYTNQNTKPDISSIHRFRLVPPPQRWVTPASRAQPLLP